MEKINTAQEIIAFIRERQGNVKTWGESNENQYVFHCYGNDGQVYRAEAANRQELSYLLAVADAELIKYM